MPLKLNEAVTVFLSVRRGLEDCLLNEIKRSRLLNCIERVHSRRTGELSEVPEWASQGEQGLVYRDVDVAATRVKRNSDDRWLYIPQPGEQPTKKKEQTAIPQPTKPKLVDKCSIRIQSGGLEVKCNRQWLVASVFGLRAVESVWLRVGTPFRCHNAEELTHRVSLLPWDSYLPQLSPEEIPLRIISKHSSVWSSVAIEECVREGIRTYNSRKQTEAEIAHVEPEHCCISVIINRNTCYIAVQCSSRLSPRPFNFAKNTVHLESTQIKRDIVPFWSLSKTRLQVHIEASVKAAGGKQARETTSEANPETTSQNTLEGRRTAEHADTTQKQLKRWEFIEEQQLLQNDKYDTADALVAGLLHAGGIFRALNNRPIRIWNPYCGNGLVIGELVALLLQLPNFTKQQPPSTIFKELAVGQTYEYYDTLIDKILGNKRRSVNDVQILASDTSILKLNQAALKLDCMASFYDTILEQDTKHVNWTGDEATLYRRYRNRLPIVTSLHIGSLGSIAPLAYNSMVIAKIPQLNKTAKSNDVYETIKGYKAFGHIIGSRSDWKGVFVITRGRAFAYFSGLEWHCVAKATGSRGDVIKLLRWTGKSAEFSSPEERTELLDELDAI